MKKIFWFLALVVVLYFTRSLWLPKIGTFLLVPDQIQKADAIVILRGEEYFRMGEGAELYKQRLAPVIVTSVTPRTIQTYEMVHRLSGYDRFSETEITFKVFEYFGIPPQTVLLTRPEVTSTYQEAQATKDLFFQQQWNSMLLVTSTYHMKRSLWIFRKVFQDTGIEIYPVTARHALYEPQQWWERERDVRRIVEEYGSFVFNWFYHFVFKKHSSSFDTV